MVTANNPLSLLCSIQVLNQEKRPQLDDAYNAYFGGLSDNVTLVPGSVAVDTPYIGCIRDILVAGSQLVNVNTVPEAPGVEKGVCRMELPFDTGKQSRIFPPIFIIT